MNVTSRPTLRQEQQAATRQRLLDAARAAFIEAGFAGATVEQIISAANTSRATFYLHFPNKTAALLATWRERDLPEVDALFRKFDEAADFSNAAARAWLADVVEYWEGHGRVGQIALQVLAVQPELNASWVAGMASVVEDMPKYRKALGGGPRARAITLNHVIELERVLYFWSNSGLPTSRDDLIDALAYDWALS
jgi:AcrR family transcriptional regulator